MRWRILVLSNECGWVAFMAGNFSAPETASVQLALFQSQYPDRQFQIVRQNR